MSGKWFFSPNGHLDITQTGGNISDSLTYMHGTIDEGTGFFNMGISGGFPFESINLSGYLAADGSSFTGTFVHGYCTGGTPTTIHCYTDSYPTTGSRCGNGELDAGEQCDDSNESDGDCCSSTCQFDDAGTSCTADDDTCTIDSCDGAGTCTHTFSPGPCTEPHGCGSGDCSSGSCVITSPTAAGTSCDLDSSVCTPDACDGAGTCAAAEPIDCTPCAVCDPTEGCVAPELNTYVYDCSRDLERASLMLRTGDDASKSSLVLKYADSPGAGSIGNPAVDTRYTACLYARDGGLDRPMLSVSIPGAASCDGSPCWEATHSGYSFKDGAGSFDGATRFSVDTEKGFRLKAEGEGLGLPSTFPSSELALSVKIVQGDDPYGPCWFRSLQTDSQDPTKYKGSYRRN